MYRDPGDDRYKTITPQGAGPTVSPLARPDAAITVVNFLSRGERRPSGAHAKSRLCGTQPSPSGNSSRRKAAACLRSTRRELQSFFGDPLLGRASSGAKR